MRPTSRPSRSASAKSPAGGQVLHKRRDLRNDAAPNKPNYVRFWARNKGLAEKQSQTKPIGPGAGVPGKFQIQGSKSESWQRSECAKQTQSLRWPGRAASREGCLGRTHRTSAARPPPSSRNERAKPRVASRGPVNRGEGARTGRSGAFLLDKWTALGYHPAFR